MLKINKIWLFCLIGLIVTACSISYKFNGASIDYTKVKTITIKDFPNQAPLVYPPLSQKFTEALKDIYIRQTRLQLVGSNGDLDLEGEIFIPISPLPFLRALPKSSFTASVVPSIWLWNGFRRARITSHHGLSTASTIASQL